MAEPKAEVPPQWKLREIAGAKVAAAEHRATERDAASQAHAQSEAVGNRTIARENWAVRNSRSCAGHDWAKERQERTGEIERSR